MLLKFWMNAFIPRDVAGYTQSITTGANAGKTAIPLPGVARLNPLNTVNPLNVFNDNRVYKGTNVGYLTDQRGFDSSFNASCRMQSWIEISLFPGPTIVRSGHRSSGTTEVYIDTGETRDFKVADMSRCTFSPIRVEPAVIHGGVYRTLFTLTPFTVNYPTSGPPSYKIDLSAAAGDPLVSAAADIDFDGTLTLTLTENPNRCHLSFEGHIDAFPAYDCYAQVGNVTKTLFTNSPPAGNTVANLLGGANRSIFGSASFP